MSGVGDDLVLLSADGPADARERLRQLIHRRAGLRVRPQGDRLTLEVAANRIEAVGPVVEAAALAAGIVLRLDALDAVIESKGLDGRASRLWAAIGDAADRRAVDRGRGVTPSIGLLHLVRVEERDGRRAAVDDRPPLVDRPSGPAPDAFPTKFDDADWHGDGAEAAGQPPDHAWTHMALYLTWLIRHHLVARARLRRRAQYVRDGGVVDREFMQWVDFQLTSDDMTDAGAAFSEAHYKDYVAAYNRVFAGEPDYSIPADADAYARVEPELDALSSAWQTTETRRVP
jgi:hypothetical protein